MHIATLRRLEWQQRLSYVGDRVMFRAIQMISAMVAIVVWGTKRIYGETGRALPSGLAQFHVEKLTREARRDTNHNDTGGLSPYFTRKRWRYLPKAFSGTTLSTERLRNLSCPETMRVCSPSQSSTYWPSDCHRVFGGLVWARVLRHRRTIRADPSLGR
jgi:hypothetical protein